MAFIREYGARNAGDPFKLRLPKRIRKMKLGRALGKVARAGVGFIPGIGGIAGTVLNQMHPAQQEQVEQVAVEAAALPAPEETNEETPLLRFARMYGWEGDPGGKPLPRRKSASAGPAVKAAKKANARKSKAAKATAATAPAAKKKGGGLGAFLGGVGSAYAQHLQNQQALAQNLGKAIPGLGNLQAIAGGLVPGGKGGFGGRRRSMNPANVKALRRGIRRIEGFEKLVKRVEKAFPRIRRAVGPARAGARGHKRGCKCAVCA